MYALRMIRACAILACVVGVLLGSGCALNPGPSTMEVAPGQYARVFDDARGVLRDMGFILERVDAQAGVITTQPKGTGGLMTPWDQEQTSFAGELEDAGQKHHRVVRVDFVPAAPELPAREITDMRSDTEPLEMQVSVAVYRWNLPGWRINTESILNSTYTHDPQLDERGMSAYAVAVKQDNDLACRIAGQIRDRVAKPIAAK